VVDGMNLFGGVFGALRLVDTMAVEDLGEASHVR
jgi:hypothetical protein